MFCYPNNKIFKTENEADLHYKVVEYIRRFYLEAILVAGLCELQNTKWKRIPSWKKGVYGWPA